MANYLNESLSYTYLFNYYRFYCIIWGDVPYTAYLFYYAFAYYFISVICDLFILSLCYSIFYYRISSLIVLFLPYYWFLYSFYIFTRCFYSEICSSTIILLFSMTLPLSFYYNSSISMFRDLTLLFYFLLFVFFITFFAYFLLFIPIFPVNSADKSMSYSLYYLIVYFYY